MFESFDLDKVKNYFIGKLNEHNATHRGVDWPSVESQEIRFSQLLYVIDTREVFSLLDYGSGYGGLYDYLAHRGYNFHYAGYDIAEPMVEMGRKLHLNNHNCWFTSNIEELPVADYAVVSGVFNMKLDADFDIWTRVVIDALNRLHTYSSKGFAFNMLTKYSDQDRMRPDLYYGDPCFFFDYCKRNFSRNVALLHDYNLYDFTILVRK